MFSFKKSYTSPPMKQYFPFGVSFLQQKENNDAVFLINFCYYVLGTFIGPCYKGLQEGL